MYSKRFSFGFSMSEVLTALGIIGILVITVLSLNKFSDSDYKIALTKMNQSDAALKSWAKAQAKSNETGLGITAKIYDQDSLTESLVNTFKSTKKNMESIEISDKTIKVAGESVSDARKIKLDNGVNLLAKHINATCDVSGGSGKACAIITLYIDTNKGGVNTTLKEEYALFADGAQGADAIFSDYEKSKVYSQGEKTPDGEECKAQYCYSPDISCTGKDCLVSVPEDIVPDNKNDLPANVYIGPEEKYACPNSNSTGSIIVQKTATLLGGEQVITIDTCCTFPKIYNKNYDSSDKTTVKCICPKDLAINEGNVFDENEASCQKTCKAGTYANISENLCLPCPAGYYCPKPALSTPIICPKGSYCPESITVDADGDKIGLISPIVCEKGTYSDKEGQIKCIDSSAGHYVDKEGSKVQIDCPAGTYSSELRAISSETCKKCPIGTYNDLPGATECKECKDSFTNEEGATFCQSCPIGSFLYMDSKSGNKECKLCSAGYYNDKTGALSCIACPKGYYAPNPGATECLPCSIGSYNDKVGQAQCTLCPQGTTNFKAGETDKSSCKNPNAGTCSDLANPNLILISNAQEFAKIGNDSAYPLNGSYCLVEDIDLSDFGTNYKYEVPDLMYPLKNGEKECNDCFGYGFKPIGYYDFYYRENERGNAGKLNIENYRFSGILDGNNKIIKNFYQNTGKALASGRNQWFMGLFGRLNGTVKNLIIVNPNIVGGSHWNSILAAYTDPKAVIDNVRIIGGSLKATHYTGALAGYHGSGLIKDSFSSAKIDGHTLVGGLVGYGPGKVESSYVTGDVNGVIYVGGLFGRQDNGSIIKNSFATGSVFASDNEVGGLVGRTGGSIENSYATGLVYSNRDEVGGLVGHAVNYVHIKDSYATGDVYGKASVGGLIGFSHATVNNCYSLGAVVGEENVGGFIGYHNYGNVYKSYWNVDPAIEMGASYINQNGDTVTSPAYLSCGYIYNESTYADSEINIIKDILEKIEIYTKSDFSMGLVSNLEIIGENAANMKKYIYFGWSDESWCFTCSNYPQLLNMPLSKLTKDTCNKNSCMVCPDNSSGNYSSGCICDDEKHDVYVSERNVCVSCESIDITKPYKNPLTGVCEACPSGSSWDEYKKECMFCPEGSKGIYPNCVCLSTGAPYFDGQECEACPDGTIFKNNNCVLKEATPLGCEAGDIAVWHSMSLNRVRNNLNGRYCVIKDISLADYKCDDTSAANKTCSEGWSPIGDYAINRTLFRGVFNGNGHKITDLYINRQDTEYQGLFGYVHTSGKILNLTVEGQVNGKNNTGMLVGAQYSGIIDNCHSMGKVYGMYYTGGLVGNVNAVSITNSSSSASIVGSYYVGGLVGLFQGAGAVIKDSYATGLVNSAAAYAGGLVGQQSPNTSIYYAYSTGDVVGYEQNGGLCGIVYGNIASSFATGNVSSINYYSGGLIGIQYGGKVVNSYARGDSYARRGRAGGFLADQRAGNIINSYATGNSSGSYGLGGFVGYQYYRMAEDGTQLYGLIQNSYYDKQSSKNNNSVGCRYDPYYAVCGDFDPVTRKTTWREAEKVTAKTTTEMYKLTDGNWSNDDWCFTCNNYPVLKGMPEGAPVATSCENACMYCPALAQGKYPSCDCSAVSGNPAYDSFANICTSCEFINPSKPAWTGTECTSCAKFNSNTPIWSSATGNCVSCATFTNNSKPIYNPVDGSCMTCSAYTNGTQPMWSGSACVSCPVNKPVWKDDKCLSCFDATPRKPIWDSENQKCVSCPSDKPYFDGINCTTCPADMPVWDETTAKCISCGAGNYWTNSSGAYGITENANICKPCPKGTYQNEANKNTCISCAAGTYQDELGQIACKSCPVGHYCNTTKLAAPIKCPVRQYQNLEGKTSCYACPKGYYCPTSAMVNPMPCTSGAYQDETGQTTCKICPAGSKCPDKGMTNHKLCGTSEYQPLEGQTICLSCPADKPVSFATYCSSCPTNKPVYNLQTASCISCDAGTYATDSSLAFNISNQPTICATCPVDTYQSEKNKHYCNPCANPAVETSTSCSCPDYGELYVIHFGHSHNPLTYMNASWLTSHGYDSSISYRTIAMLIDYILDGAQESDQIAKGLAEVKSKMSTEDLNRTIGGSSDGIVYVINQKGKVLASFPANVFLDYNSAGGFVSGRVLNTTAINNSGITKIKYDITGRTHKYENNNQIYLQYFGGNLLINDLPCSYPILTAIKEKSPIILDLKHNGIKLTDITNGVMFDIQGNGQKVLTSWTEKQDSFDDAFLVYDKNKDNQITSGKELFGDQSGSATGYEELAKYDDNNDGVLDENDKIFSELKLWCDKNKNAVVDEGELQTLKEQNIVSISTSYKVEYDEFGNLKRDVFGNIIGYTSSFVQKVWDASKNAWDYISGLTSDIFFKFIDFGTTLFD